MRKVEIKLTREQKRDLEAMFNKIDAMNNAGKPGMLIAQIWPSGMDVRIIDHKTAKQLTHLTKGEKF